LALVVSFELLMMLVRSARRASVDQVPAAVVPEPVPHTERDEAPMAVDVPALERTVRDRHDAGQSQRAIARDLNIDRRKVKRIIEQAA
jgi:ActR/RegA family two-component response regulator